MRTWPLPSVKEGFVTFLLSELVAEAASGDPSTLTRSTLALRDKAGDAEGGLGRIVFEWRWRYERAFDPAVLAPKGLRVPDTPLRVNEAGEAVGIPRLLEDAAAVDMPDLSTGDVIVHTGAGSEGGMQTISPAGLALSAGQPGREMRDGDWQVHVHVIEARNLRAGNWNGTSSPIVHVTVGGQKQHTEIHRNTDSCVFDRHMVFALPGLSKDEAEALVATITVREQASRVYARLCARACFNPPPPPSSRAARCTMRTLL
jgi:hypothetical protein